MLDATVWSVGEVEGLSHDATQLPAVPPPEEVPHWWSCLAMKSSPPAHHLLLEQRRAKAAGLHSSLATEQGFRANLAELVSDSGRERRSMILGWTPVAR